MADDIVSRRYKELMKKNRTFDVTAIPNSSQQMPLIKQDQEAPVSQDEGDLVSRRFKILMENGKIPGNLSIRKDDLVSRRYKELSNKTSQQTSNRGMYPAFKSGFKSGVTGILTGQEEQEPDEDASWYERLSSLAGETISDLPGMALGGELGAVAGAPIGPIGAVAGGAAGAFALPTLLKHSFAEYRDYVKEGEDLTFGDFLERAGRTAKETGKAAIIGGVAGKMSRLLPILKEIPGASKLLNTRPGQALGKGALELLGITGAQTAIERELPTGQQIAENAALLAGMHGAGIAAEKVGLGKIVKPITKPLVDKVSTIVEKVGKILPESVKEVGSVLYESAAKVRKGAKSKAYFEMLKDHIGERDAKIVENQFKWRENLETAEKGGKFSKENLEDMMYYRQKTGNPFKEGDTYKDVAKRLPEEARHFVDHTIDEHFKNSLKAWNDNPATRNINPREALENIYLPGLYEYDSKLFNKAYDEVSRKFKTKNPFSNEKKFLSYLEAFKEAGLKPRYKNIVELMGAYDRIMIKSMANNELLQNIKKYEKDNDIDLVVNPSNKRKYREAKKSGYIPFDDIYLRRYVAGKKEGKTIHAVSPYPALVNPDFAQAFQGVFNKNAYKPDHPFFKYYDSAANSIRFARVALSPFHYGALMESALGAKGSNALLVKKWLREGGELRKNKEFMMDAAKSGLVTDPIEPHMFKKGESLINKAIEYTGKKETPESIQKVLNLTKSGMEYLFKEFHPRLKLSTWNEYTNDTINKLIKEGRPPSEVEIKNIKRDTAELVNNMYGGQRWETMKYLNNPKSMKWLRRMIGYTDWTVSAARQAMDAFAPGLKGEMGRKYWMKYGMYFMMTQGLLKFINSGYEQTDEENKSISGVRWNPEKALEGLTKGDPSKWYQFPLPDFDVTIAGIPFNPGRDSIGKKLYGHFGKQMLEIGRYFTDPASALFSKANPLIQIVGKQILGGTPYEGKIFPARYAYKAGKSVPWEGTERGSLEEYISRGKEVISDVMPFSLKRVLDVGIAPTVASGLGTIPVSKGLSITKAEPLMRKALKAKNTAEINRIRRTLRDNGYKERSIKSMITRARKP